MLPSMLSNLFWGAPQPVEPVGVSGASDEVKHTTSEEAGDWLLISCQNSSESGPSQGNSECDVTSVCSDSSWVITPAPTFQRSAGSAYNNSETHPFEDLLIEHPTMSVYRQNSTNEEESAIRVDAEPSEGIDEDIEEQNQNRELALLQNRQRQQLAIHMDIPANTAKKPQPKSGSGGKPPKLTRRALKRHDPMSRISAKHQVQKCGFKAGRRRC